MDTVDKADEVKPVAKKRGRPAKQDKPTPLGEYIADEAKKAKERKETNRVIEKWYELSGRKLLLCKRKQNGVVYRVFVGSLDDVKHGQELREFAEKQKAEGNLKTRI